MTKSFDDWYKEAKKLNDDGFSAKDFFEAGQQSKQDEVDDLERKLRFKDASIKNLKLQLENRQIDCDISDNKVDELQKRIDKVVKWVEINKSSIPLSEWHGYTTEEYVDADDLLDILKGE